MDASNPQLENGHFHIANELFEAMILRIPCRMPGPFLIFMAVMRETYGFNRKSAEISIKRFSKLTGIRHRNNIYRAIKEAVEYNLIKAIGNDCKKAITYSVNKKYSEWKKQSEMIAAIGNDCKSNRKRLHKQSEMMAVCILKTPSKDTIKDNSISPIPENFTLTPGLKAFAIKKGIPEETVENWFDAFKYKNQASGDKKKDWASAWFAYISSVATNSKNRASSEVNAPYQKILMVPDGNS